MKGRDEGKSTWLRLGTAAEGRRRWLFYSTMGVMLTIDLIYTGVLKRVQSGTWLRQPEQGDGGCCNNGRRRHRTPRWREARGTRALAHAHTPPPALILPASPVMVAFTSSPSHMHARPPFPQRSSCPPPWRCSRASTTMQRERTRVCALHNLLLHN